MVIHNTLSDELAFKVKQLIKYNQIFKMEYDENVMVRFYLKDNAQHELYLNLQPLFNKSNVLIDLDVIHQMKRGDCVEKDHYSLQWFKDGSFKIISRRIDFMPFYNLYSQIIIYLAETLKKEE